MNIKGIKDSNRALTLDKNNIYALNNRGWGYNNLKEYNKALKDLGHAISINPNYEWPYANRGLSFFKLLTVRSR